MNLTICMIKTLEGMTCSTWSFEAARKQRLHQKLMLCLPLQLTYEQ